MSRGLGNLWLTARRTLGPALASINGEKPQPFQLHWEYKSLPEMPSFQICECKIRENPPGFPRCSPPTLLSKSFPWSWWDLYSDRRWLGSVVSVSTVEAWERGLSGGCHAASSVLSITLFITWRYSVTTGERFSLKLLFCWYIYFAPRHDMS